MELAIDGANANTARFLAEAWDWLAIHGLIARIPGSEGEWSYVTSRGRELIDNPNALQTIQATERINIGLHQSIALRIRSQFLLGEYESAVFLAFREVEIRVRRMGAFPDRLLGVDLMHQAFNKTTGPLADKSLDGGEQQAIMDLFAGAIGSFKNPSSHRQVDYGDVTLASEAVLLADLLLRILDQYESRRTAEES